ncbi:GTPase Era [Rubeoparvulum massiliense]|uniref:GTPase Era n=1 Tax=Rubeoparvulum massiliense TaxID=1631346 RepID=UPI00065E8236|nr:GTPase Era [Rubeoparvulum massiliense]
MEAGNNYRSGFIALIGRPNVGKSTLMNQMVGSKVAIMSDKPQTTRNRIRAIYTDDAGQAIFIDTPGIHKPRSALGHNMVRVALDTLSEVDLILFVIDVTQELGGGDQFILEQLRNVDTPVFLILNKIDQVHPTQLLPVIDQYRTLYSFAEIVPVSALNGNNVETLLQVIMQYLPEGPQFYPTDQVTDHPERFIIGELIREKTLQLTSDEVPHSIAVVVDQIEPGEREDVVVVHATIYVERPSQKAIVIGKQGKMLQEIGTRARQDIERLLGSKLFLHLWVRVKKDWKNREDILRDFGYFEEE